MLGLVSMLTDISSEMVSGLLPVYLLTVVGVSASVVGLIEGLAGATSMAVKVFSGGWSDYLGRRKPFVLTGYALSALAKPLLALAPTASWILSARLMDRVGKGVRDAPRDALITDITPSADRGAAFGLRQALDTVGAFVGPLLAMGLMLLWANDYSAVFWAACVPASMAVLLLWRGVKDPVLPSRTGPPPRFAWSSLASMGQKFWWLVGLGAAFNLARFSEAFLVLRAQHDGLPLAWTPLVLIAMNLVYAGLVYPFSRWSDRLEATLLLSGSLLVLGTADAMLAVGGNWVWPGIALWGLHMAMSQGVLSAMVANAAPIALRGTAFGVFNLVGGLGLLLASVAAGLVWDRVGPHAPFVAGAFWCLVALLILVLRRRRKEAC
jgi:MFS family permease